MLSSAADNFGFGNLALVSAFFIGGVLGHWGHWGALGFKHIGYAATIPLALGLVLLSSAPMFKPQT